MCIARPRPPGRRPLYNPVSPVPTIVVMLPEGSTLRMRWLPLSAMKRLPVASTATPLGVSNWAWTAGPPSPAKPRTPVPAMVVMMPEESTLCMLLLVVSEKKSLPAASTATDRILELQKQHGLELPEEFFFRYAEVLERLGLYDEAIAAATKYLTLAGRDGEHYRAALELLITAFCKQFSLCLD